uniref:DDE Tnp4 domain-containing protein n=1 Tax=Mycena chlorophos TaxID=658473 RepID=A0ABQ0KWU9_MYCCL|nr:predicted protein [Mycena chlorophos]
MPTLPICERLLRNTAKYAAKQPPLPVLDRDDSQSSDDGSDAETDTEDARYLQEYEAIRRCRIDFLTSKRVLCPHEVDKEEQLTLLLERYKSNDIPRFWRNLSVTPPTFDALLAHIQLHPVFIGGEGAASQTPVDQQLAIALYHFDHFGNAVSLESIAQSAGKLAGTVVNATRRVMIGFLSMHDKVIRWPSDAEREQAKQWVEDQTCREWRNRWLFVDRTLVLLADKPRHHREAYFDRKSNYSLNVQLINTSDLHIIDYVLGPTGSMHDLTAFKEYEQLLDRNVWIWADLAYALQDWVITLYKKQANTVRENRIYNSAFGQSTRSAFSKAIFNHSAGPAAD